MHGYIYICHFSNGLIKVGLSSHQPKQRIKSHEKFVKNAFNHSLVDSYVSPSHYLYKENEKILIDKIKDKKVDIGDEWCQGACFKSLVDFCLKKLNFRKANEDEINKIKSSSEEMMKVINENFVNGIDYDWIAAGHLSKYLQLIAEDKCPELDSLQPSASLNGISSFQLMAALYIYFENEKLVSFFIEMVSTANSDLNSDDYIGIIVSNYSEYVLEQVRSGKYSENVIQH